MIAASTRMLTVCNHTWTAAASTAVQHAKDSTLCSLKHMPALSHREWVVFATQRACKEYSNTCCTAGAEKVIPH